MPDVIRHPELVEFNGFRLKACRNDAVDVCPDDVVPKLAPMPLAGGAGGEAIRVFGRKRGRFNNN